jgi:hypothetical protein
VSKGEFIVSLGWKDQREGQKTFYLAGFSIHIDLQKGEASPTDQGFVRLEFIADSPRFEEIRQRLQYFRPVLEQWRADFGRAAARLAPEIQKAFDGHRELGAFVTTPVTCGELQHALEDPRQKYDFQLADLNQFAGKWHSLSHTYRRDRSRDATLAQCTWWLDTVPGPGGLYQRVTGSRTQFLDPLQTQGNEEDLTDLVLDAYLPDIGIGGWVSKFWPGQLECPLLAYKLAGNRFLWISQRFDRQAALEAQAKKRQLPPNSKYDLALEWIVISGARKRYYLVADSYDIDFRTGTMKPLCGPSDFIVKSESQL